MPNLLRRVAALLRPTPALVVALLALAVASSGAAYAFAIPKASVGTKQLKTAAVTGAKVKDGSLTAQDLAAGALTSGPAGPQGVPGPQGPQGVPGPTASYVFPSPLAGSATGSLNGVATMASGSLPAGTYVVDASVTLVSSTSGNVICRVGAGTPSTFQFNNDDALLTLPANTWTRLSDTKQLTLSSASTVPFTCVTPISGAVTYGQVHVVATKIG